VLPLVSVVIPTFNRKDLVLRALKSVAQQSYSAIEVIVVDDASTDGTVEALRDREFPISVRIVRLSANQGPAGARNGGIRHAAGKYVAFLDSDDQWLPDKVERQVEEAERNGPSGAVLVYSRAVVWRRREMQVRPRRPIHEREEVADYLFANGEYLSPSAVLISSDAARAVPYRPEMRLHEDWDWFIRLQKHGVKFVMLPEVQCVMDDRSVEGRGSAPRPDCSLSVVEAWKTGISRKAYFAFRAGVAPHMRQTAALRALTMIAEAYLHGAIDAWRMVVLTGRLVHPEIREGARWLRDAIAPRHRMSRGKDGEFLDWDTDQQPATGQGQSSPVVPDGRVWRVPRIVG
jgi:glycosyltransferase involved in cell wall biosynthesis